MKTIFWLGAHKTGTTFLQRCLDLSQDVLAHRHIQYTELEEFRVKYGRPLLNERPDHAPEPTGYDSDADGQILVFDENIPGYVQHALSRRGFYPDAITRTNTIADHLRLEIDEIVFGIRSYVGYLPSLYIETLKSTPFISFDEYLEQAFRPKQPAPQGSIEHTKPPIDFERLNWFGLVDRIAKAYPDVRVRIYFHEQLRGNEAVLLSEVLGLPADDITMLGEVERVGFSQRAVAAMHELYEQGPVQAADVRKAIRRYPTGPDDPTYSPLDDAERHQLGSNYERDVSRIRSDDRFDIIDLAG